MFARRIALAVMALCLMCVCAGSGLCATVYVSTTGSDSNSGVSWAQAKATVQAGVDAAVSGDEVWVAAGTYTGCVTTKDGVALYGGFAGTEASLAERDWEVNVTTLDGAEAGSVVTVPTGAASARVDGFTITNGKAQSGGGIYCLGSAVIANNKVHSNRADVSGSTINNYGGGIYCSDGNVIIESNTISQNIVSAYGTNPRYGAGVYCSSGTFTIRNNTIEKNRAYLGGFGGGIYSIDSSISVIGNQINSNKAEMAVSGPWGETSGGYGGAIYCKGGTATIIGNTVAGNLACLPAGRDDEQQGGTCIQFDSGSAECNVIKRNQGVAIYCGDATITGNVVTKNGGGIMVTQPSYIISNSVVENWGNNIGISCESSGSSSVVYNNIIAFNEYGLGYSYGTTTVKHNCVYGNHKNFYYAGLDATNIIEDPMLADRFKSNLHLQPTSPCRNRGANSAPYLLTTDIDGQSRILDMTVDIGADESDGTLWEPSEPAIVYVSPTGHDANNGLSWASSKATLQAGIRAAYELEGGEVWVAAGTYTDTQDQIITVKSYVDIYGGFNGSETARDQRNWSLNKSIVEAKLDLSHGSTYTNAVDGFVIRNTDVGIESNYRLRASNNQIIGCSQYGIYCAPQKLYEFSFSNNVVSNCDAGIRVVYSSVYPGTGTSTVTNNTVTKSAGYGISVGGAGSVSNNLVAFNSSGVSAGSSVNIQNNCVYNPDGTNYSGIAPGTGDISADPKFVSLEFGELMVQPDSPCVDAGLDSAVVDSDDIGCNSRVQGAHVDIGAYESDGNPQTFTPNIVYVKTTGDNVNDGLSWASAKRTVQAGIDVAASIKAEVWVAEGVYAESLQLQNYVYLYGGFAGSETLREQRDWKSKETILDGSGTNRVVYGSYKMSRGLSCIDGFTIRNGYSGAGAGVSTKGSYVVNNRITGNQAPMSDGGGVYCNGGYVINNIITNNSAGSGGGVYASGSSVVQDNTIVGNTASNGGGIYNSGSAIKGNMIVENNATSTGGGIYNSNGMRVVNNTVVGNTAASTGGGAMYCVGTNSASNNIFAFNSSGVRCATNATVTLRNNDVYNPAGINYSNTTAGIGDISVDPLFVDLANGDYHLTSASPCINAGWNDAPGLPLFDFDGRSRILEGVADMGAYEYILWTGNISGARTIADGAAANLTGSIITAAFPDCFYIESENRACGIRVEKASHGLLAGMKADITGTVATNASGEKCIAATTATQSGTGSIAPLGLAGKALAGEGLDCTGLLVRTWGKIIDRNPVWFSVDDGSGLPIKCVLPQGVPLDPSHEFASLTGVVSCEKLGDEVVRVVLVSGDIESM